MNTETFYMIKYPDTDLSQVRVLVSEEDSYSGRLVTNIHGAGRTFHTVSEAEWYLSERIKSYEKSVHQGNYEENVKSITRLKSGKVIPLTLTLSVGELK